MSTNNNKKYEINNKIDKEIDCIFTGQITKYRLKIFDLLKENNIKAVFRLSRGRKKTRLL